MNLETVSLQDCLDNYNFKEQCVILNDGKLIGFQQEEIPTQTANPSGDEQPDKAITIPNYMWLFGKSQEKRRIEKHEFTK